MDNSNDTPLQQAERDEPLLFVAITVILKRHRVSIKHCFSNPTGNPTRLY